MLKLKINGISRTLSIDPEKPLLWALREDLKLTGAKYGCGVGSCGACLVLVDGEAINACLLPVSDAVDKDIVTIEGLAKDADAPDDKLHPVQQAWIDHQVPQCGYCQSGMMIAAASLLKNNPAPTDEDIDAGITNLCRCGTYPRVRKAVKSLSQKV